MCMCSYVDLDALGRTTTNLHAAGTVCPHLLLLLLLLLLPHAGVLQGELPGKILSAVKWMILPISTVTATLPLISLTSSN